MPFPGVPISNEAAHKNLPCARGGVTADLPRGGDGGLMVQFPCPNRSVCLHRRGRPPGRPGGTSKTQHMLWANSYPSRCGFVQWFFFASEMSSQGFPARGRRSGKDVSPRPSVSTGAPPFRKGGLGLPRAPAPRAKTERSARGPHPPQAVPLPRARGRLLAGDRKGRPYSGDGTQRSETSSVIRLAGDRRMPPSPCAGKASGGRPQGRRAPLRLQIEKPETKN